MSAVHRSSLPTLRWTTADTTQRSSLRQMKHSCVRASLETPFFTPNQFRGFAVILRPHQLLNHVRGSLARPLAARQTTRGRAPCISAVAPDRTRGDRTRGDRTQALGSSDKLRREKSRVHGCVRAATAPHPQGAPRIRPLLLPRARRIFAHEDPFSRANTRSCQV